MCKVISVANHKGGVAKTTSVVNIGIGIARKGQRVLLVDADPQGSLTSSLGFPEPDLIEYTLADGLDKILEGKDYDPMEGILHHEEGVDLIPGNIDLSVLGVNLIRAMRAEFVLKEYLESLKEKYDWILIDCMPSLEKLTVNALAAADSVIIPVQTGYLPTKGLAQIKNTIDKVIRRKVNAKLKIEGILLTMVEPRTNNCKEIIAKIKEDYGDKLPIFNSEIPLSVRVSECAGLGQSIYKHNPRGKAAKAYEELCMEILDASVNGGECR